MAFANDTYATLWEVKEDRGFVQGRISTSKLRAERQPDGTFKSIAGEYETDFSGFVTFGGAAADKARALQFPDGDRPRLRIKLLRVAVKQRYVKEAGRTYTNFYVYDFEMGDDNTTRTTQEPPKFDPSIADGVDEELPFS